MSLVWIPLGIAAAAFCSLLIALLTGADPEFERKSAERSQRRSESREASRARALEATAAEGRPKWMGLHFWYVGQQMWIFNRGTKTYSETVAPSVPPTEPET